MPRNGSGTFTLVSGNPVVTGTVISSTVQNNTMTDIATALTQSIAANGQTPITADIPMSSHKLTGLAAASVDGDAVRFEQVFNGAAGSNCGPILISAVTASAASTVDFTSGISSTYKMYKIVGTDVHPGTDNVELRMLVSTDSGSTWNTSSVYYSSGYSSASGGVGGAYASSAQAYGSFGGGRGNSASHGGLIEIEIGNPASTTYVKPMKYDACYPQPAGTGGFLWSAGQVYWSSTSAVNGFRLYMSSGTITGTFKLYGVY